jgi:hypothetical protein
MRLDPEDYRSSQAEEHSFHEPDQTSDVMTPARRAALEALEREFRDLLNANPR